MFKGKGLVPAPAATVRDIVRDANLNPKWDKMFKAGRVVEPLDAEGGTCEGYGFL